MTMLLITQSIIKPQQSRGRLKENRCSTRRSLGNYLSRQREVQVINFGLFVPAYGKSNLSSHHKSQVMSKELIKLKEWAIRTANQFWDT